ncbi:probable inactive receptor kinase RLK902 [Lolium rigidum]|uniref:probable inactive receptor kinase RLK902 n=1 Tax=Lolium rigidum TaxID=89674 RepID=UPI001F5C3E60|nr:probable inactive receptor kinase RLK902 [Lolium rigidum]
MDRPENTISQLIQEDHRSKWIAHSNHNVKCFTEDEIIRITNNFETMLGKGSFGEVYKGVLEDQSIVAVKRFIHNVKEDFAKELTVHSEINHKNVVRLVGYCADENALMMVTEYVIKGNLSDALHRENTPIPLDTRLRIAIECAEALCYMHSQMYTRVIHGDIKPANILLDDRLNAKLSDFGISRLVNTENTLYTLNVIGSIGYMDPLFALDGRLTPKSDVYSFGVVLVELITRKKAKTDDGDVGLVKIFTQSLAKGIRRVREMFDAEIAIPGDLKTVEEIAKLAGKCLRLEFDKRPDMLEVAERLRKLRNAAHERTARFSWGRRYKPAQAQTKSSQESNIRSQSVRIAAPAKVAPSQESNSRSQSVRTAAQVEVAPSQERSGTIHYVGNFRLSSTATDNLLELVDLLQAPAGGYTGGSMYRLTLRENGVKLAVKRVKGADLSKAEFEQRATMIGAIQSEHIVPLQAYYYDKNEILLMYDSFTSLEQALYGEGGPCPLDLKQRVAISLAAARGVAYIHSVGPSSCHGNINSSNVILKRNYGASLLEHGLTTLGLFPGVSGYSAPEITDANWVSQEADVYSFGVLMLELLTGKPPLRRTEHAEEGAYLPWWVRSVGRRKWRAKVIDMQLLARQHAEGEDEFMVRLLLLGINCSSEDAKLRPTIHDVVQHIEEMTT